MTVQHYLLDHASWEDRGRGWGGVRETWITLICYKYVYKYIICRRELSWLFFFNIYINTE